MVKAAWEKVSEQVYTLFIDRGPYGEFFFPEIEKNDV